MSEGTDLLEFICTKCTNNLRKTYDFLRLVRTTEDVLRNYVKTLENTVKGGESLAGLMERNYKELKIIYPMEGDFDANNDRFVYDERSGIEIIKLQPVCENDVVRVKDEKELKEQRNEIVSVDVAHMNTSGKNYLRFFPLRFSIIILFRSRFISGTSSSRSSS